MEYRAVEKYVQVLDKTENIAKAKIWTNFDLAAPATGLLPAAECA